MDEPDQVVTGLKGPFPSDLSSGCYVDKVGIEKLFVYSEVS